MPVAHGVLISMNLKCQRGIPDVSITFHGILLLLKMSCKLTELILSLDSLLGNQYIRIENLIQLTMRF